MEQECSCGAALAICRICKRIACTETDNGGAHSYLHARNCKKLAQEADEQKEKEKESKKKRRDSFSDDDSEKPGEKSKSTFKPPPKDEKISKKSKVEEIASKHAATSNDNSRSSKEVCEEKSKQKRDPEKPKAATVKQVKFLEKFASPKNCTCSVPLDLTNILFDDYESARQQVEAFINLHRKAKEEKGKSQQCDAYTILKKNGKFLILKTNSCHSQKSDTIDEKLKTLRPAIEPELLPATLENVPRIYTVTSCPACNLLEHEKTIAITSTTDFEQLKNNEMLKDLFGGKLETFLYYLKKKKHTDDYRLIFVSQIQPNENAQTEQEGWTLHHSEIESYFFAQKHGWEVVQVFIDRDCCKVCGATLKGMAKDFYDKIVIWDDKRTDK